VREREAYGHRVVRLLPADAVDEAEEEDRPHDVEAGPMETAPQDGVIRRRTTQNDVIVMSATSTRPGTPTKKFASVTIGGRSGAYRP
jgi:hypothetical protein